MLRWPDRKPSSGRRSSGRRGGRRLGRHRGGSERPRQGWRHSPALGGAVHRQPRHHHRASEGGRLTCRHSVKAQSTIGRCRWPTCRAWQARVGSGRPGCAQEAATPMAPGSGPYSCPGCARLRAPGSSFSATWQPDCSRERENCFCNGSTDAVRNGVLGCRKMGSPRVLFDG